MDLIDDLNMIKVVRDCFLLDYLTYYFENYNCGFFLTIVDVCWSLKRKYNFSWLMIC